MKVGQRSTPFLAFCPHPPFSPPSHPATPGCGPAPPPPARPAVLGRGVARLSANVFLHPSCAALVAGVIGGLAVRCQLSSSLRLVAVCPCMVLVPGPHVLNGALDLINGRIHLGAARLTYAGLV